MAISFTIQHIPDLKKGKGHSLPVAYDQPYGTYNMDDICTQACARSTLSPADVKAALDSFAWVIQNHRCSVLMRYCIYDIEDD